MAFKNMHLFLTPNLMAFKNKHLFLTLYMLAAAALLTPAELWDSRERGRGLAQPNLACSFPPPISHPSSSSRLAQTSWYIQSTREQVEKHMTSWSLNSTLLLPYSVGQRESHGQALVSGSGDVYAEDMDKGRDGECRTVVQFMTEVWNISKR